MHTASGDNSWSISYSSAPQLNRLLWLRDIYGLSSYIYPMIPPLESPVQHSERPVGDVKGFVRQWLQRWDEAAQDSAGVARAVEIPDAYPLLQERIEQNLDSITECEHEWAMISRRQRPDERPNVSAEVAEVQALLDVATADFQITVSEVPCSGDLAVRVARGHVLVSPQVGTSEAQLRASIRPLIVELLII